MHLRGGPVDVDSVAHYSSFSGGRDKRSARPSADHEEVEAEYRCVSSGDRQKEDLGATAVIRVANEVSA
jgi:hypothetical protein